jgi:uncharacterized protein YkwD
MTDSLRSPNPNDPGDPHRVDHRRHATLALCCAALLIALFMAAFAELRRAREPRPGPVPPRPRPAPAPAPVEPFSADQRALLEEHNRVRQAHGMYPLTLDLKLTRAAQGHAADMAAKGRLRHGDPFARIRGSGYPFARAGENIAWNQRDPRACVGAWMGDLPHRDNVLGKYVHLGAGVARGPRGDPYWCCDYGTPGTPGAGSSGDVSAPEPVGGAPP